jgi:hypothetical protein
LSLSVSFTSLFVEELRAGLNTGQDGVQRLRRLTIDTDRQRTVVRNGIFAPRGRVVYTAGPRVDYTDTVATHLRALIRGEVDDWGDPATSQSLPITAPEPIVQ